MLFTAKQLAEMRGNVQHEDEQNRHRQDDKRDQRNLDYVQQNIHGADLTFNGDFAPGNRSHREPISLIIR